MSAFERSFAWGPMRLLYPALRGHLDCSAASGLVADRETIAVVADDEHTLFVYDRETLAPLRHTRLFADPLPRESRARKAAKADLEMLTRLPDGRLLALGSGSTPQRNRGAVVTADDVVTRFDLSPLYAELSERLPALNLEGACIVGDALVLLQRGNGAEGINALVTLSLDAALTCLSTGAAWTPALLRGVHPVALPTLQGVPLGLTDACPHPTRPDAVVFVCAAEAGGSTYEDGEYVGSAVGIVGLDGALLEPLSRLMDVLKIEGVHAEAGENGALELVLVSDPDDPTVRAPLYRVTVPPG